MKPQRNWGSLQAIDKVIARVARDRGWQKRLDRSAVWRRWEEVAGEAVARHAWPLKVVQGEVLVLAVSDSVWMQQLSLQSQVLLDGLNRLLPHGSRLRAIRFRQEDVDGIREAFKSCALRQEKGRILPKGTRKEETEAERLVAELPDPELRRLFKRAYLLYLNRKKVLGYKGGSKNS